MSEMPSRMAQGSQSDKEERGTRAGHYGRRVPVSHARIFPSLVKALGWRVPGPASGSSTPASLASYDRATRSWKTSERLLAGGLMPYSGALPKSGTMRNGRIYEPQMSERHIPARDYGLLPTPTARDSRTLSGSQPPRRAKTSGIPLAWLVALSIPKAQRRGRRLNPEWEECLMGYPMRWTDCAVSEIALSLKSRN